MTLPNASLGFAVPASAFRQKVSEKSADFGRTRILGSSSIASERDFHGWIRIGLAHDPGRKPRLGRPALGFNMLSKFSKTVGLSLVLCIEIGRF